MTNSSNSSNGRGKIGNTKQSSPSYRFCFTLNNWTEAEYSQLLSFFKDSSKKFIIGKEVGEKKTPHLQGYVVFKDKQRFSGISKINERIHWEKCKGSEEQNIAYCSKDGDFVTHNIKVKKPLKILEKSKLYNWQIEIENIITKEPDDRKIYWYYDIMGGKGKTTFAKYLSFHYGAVPIEGKKNDILFCCAEFESDIYIFDFERSMEDFVPYGAIEKVKNGYFMCGKYESKPILRNPPHIIIFANFSPDMLKLSMDRWVIKDIASL